MRPFFADSYAILGALNRDPAFVARFRGARFRTSLLNLYEVFYVLLRRGMTEPELTTNLQPYEAVATAPGWSTLRAAARFRSSMLAKARHLSFIDAATYTQAREVGLPFLTGDPAFRGVDGVEFLAAVRGKRGPAA